MNFKDNYISSQYIFSDWIFLWTLIYLSPLNQNKTSSTNYFNPLFSLYGALCVNIFMFVVLLAKNSALNILVKYVLMMLVEKIIPISLLSHEINYLHIQTNIVFTVGLFILYLAYLHLSNTSIYEVYSGIYHSITVDDNNTPFFYLFHKLFGI